MLSNDAQNLAKSIREMEKKAAQFAQILNCIAVNMESLADSIQSIEKNKIVSSPAERPFYEDVKETA